MARAKILLLVILSGCTATISPEDMEKAKTLCDSNGGLKYVITFSDNGYLDIYCKNGAKFAQISRN